MELPKERLLDMYKKMVAIREFELSIAKAVTAATCPGFVHLGVGQEAVMVGVAAALRPTDWLSATHREHGLMIARDADMKRCRAEIFGRVTGYCKGKGGSMHLAVYEKRALGCNGILGPSQTINNGIAIALKYQGEGDIAVVVFGDGAANRGEFHEALNLAAIWKLPSLFICVNNEYGMGGHVDDVCSVEDISSRAMGYGMPGITVDGCDIMAVYEAVSETAKSIRDGKGPALIELKTVRWRGHYEGDPEVYRPDEHKEAAIKRDAIAIFCKQLLDQGIAKEEELEAIRDEVDKEVQEAEEFTNNSGFPPLEEMYTDMFYEERSRVQ